MKVDSVVVIVTDTLMDVNALVTSIHRGVSSPNFPLSPVLSKKQSRDMEVSLLAPSPAMRYPPPGNSNTSDTRSFHLSREVNLRTHSSLPWALNFTNKPDEGGNSVVSVEVAAIAKPSSCVVMIRVGDSCFPPSMIRAHSMTSPEVNFNTRMEVVLVKLVEEAATT
jgi:hypothetical protein